MSSTIKLKDRQTGMIWGQLIGDAAALGTHWIYDLKDLQEKYPHGVQGFEPSPPGHYHAGKKPGELTHYGVAALEMLRSLVRCSRFSATDFGTRFVNVFASPDYHGYIDQTIRETIRNYHDFLEDVHPDLPYEFQYGSNNDDISCATRLAPVLAMYWDDGELYDTVERATKVTQNNEWAITYMDFHARIVRRLLKGDSLNAAFEKETHSLPHDTPITAHIRQKISQAIDLVPLTTTEATMQLGQACPLPQSFPASVQCALKHQYSFSDAVTATLSAGGDNAGRAALIGTWLGACSGIACIPRKWITRLSDHDEIANLIHSLVQNEHPVGDYYDH
jgi:ADP-ribosylglycohydrolase